MELMSIYKLTRSLKQNEINRGGYKDGAAHVDMEYWERLYGEDGILFELELDFGEREGFQ